MAEATREGAGLMEAGVMATATEVAMMGAAMGGAVLVEAKEAGLTVALTGAAETAVAMAAAGTAGGMGAVVMEAVGVHTEAAAAAVR